MHLTDFHFVKLRRHCFKRIGEVKKDLSGQENGWCINGLHRFSIFAKYRPLKVWRL